MSPALAGGLLTSEPPGMSFSLALIFDKLTMIYLGMVFFAFDSFSFLDLCFCFHNVWNISALFLQTLFFCPNLFLLLLGLQLHMFQAVCLLLFFFSTLTWFLLGVSNQIFHQHEMRSCPRTLPIIFWFLILFVCG